MPNDTSGNPKLEAFARQPPKLEGGVDLRVDLVDARHARLRLQHNGQRAQIRAAFLSVPYPSGLRRLLAQEPNIDAVIVDRLPSGLLAAAEQAGVGVLDSRGHGRLVAPGFVYVVPPPPMLQSVNRRATASPFAPKASRLVRALLAEPAQPWRLSRLAEAVDVDVGNAHRILAGLVDIGVVERDEESYRVIDPGSLLEAWADFYRPPKERIQIPVVGDLETNLREVIAAVEGAAVVSGEFAAERYAPYLSASGAVVHCLSATAWESLRSPDKLPSHAPAFAPRGRIMVDLVDEGVAQFASAGEGFSIVHPVQVYVDLFRDPGRGREAAEHLRRELLPY